MHSDGSRSDYFEKHVVHFSGEENGLLQDGTLYRLGKNIMKIQPYTHKAEREQPAILTYILRAVSVFSTNADSIVRAERMKILALQIYFKNDVLIFDFDYYTNLQCRKVFAKMLGFGY